MCAGPSSACINARTLGGLTGSLTALCLSRVPIQSTLQELDSDALRGAVRFNNVWLDFVKLIQRASSAIRFTMVVT